MRYSYAFKRKCVEMYRHQKQYPKTPKGVKAQTFQKHVREWVELEDCHGPEILKHKHANTVWTADEKFDFELKKVDAVAKRNSQLSHEIRTIFKKYQGRYGVRRVYQALRNQGLVVNHKRVQRIMHREGLLGKRPREKYHSYLGEVGKIADNIINRDFSTTGPFQKWTTDVSQFNI